MADLQIPRTLPEGQSLIPQVRNAIAIASAKGGVGKSTVCVNTALAMARTGARVGLLDADIYGPSTQLTMGIRQTPEVTDGNRLVPIEKHGLKLMSMGFLADDSTPVVWRGPLLAQAVQQFLSQVEWGELDFLFLDLPPGTGDIPLTLAQSIPMTGSVVVCTPQDVALMDARRAIKMYEQLNVACLGIIENMSYYLCPKCGHRDEVFDHGGAEGAAKELGVPFLGGIPLNTDLRRFGDSGAPEKCFTDCPDYVSEAIAEVVAKTAGQISIKADQESAVPTLTIE